MRRFADFTSSLSKAGSPGAVADLLSRQLEAWFPDADRAIGLYLSDGSPPSVLHTTSPRAIELVEQNASTVAGTGSTIENPDGTVIVEPIVTGTDVHGLVALGSLQRPFTPSEAEILRVMVTAAGAHLAGLKAPEVHDWSGTTNALSVALCTVSPSGHVLHANRAFATLVGEPEEALPGTLLLPLLTSAWQEALSPMLRADYRGGIRLIEHTAGPLGVRAYRLDPSPTSDVVLLFDDHTEQRHLQQQLIQSEKMSAIGQLIAGVAHDLNNPLASVVGFADYLVETNQLPEQYREPLRVIQQEAERAAGIVKNLLTFARKHEGRRRPTALPRLLEVTTDLLRNELASNKVELLVELDANLPELYIEPNQIQQVIVNLVTNAAQAIMDTGRPGRILVRAQPLAASVAIDVCDSGPGIPEDDRAHIFEPFYTTKAEGFGTGLGLSISAGLVMEHGGHIMLMGSGAQGSVFRVELPSTSVTDLETPKAEHAPTVRGMRILIVDDEPHILHYMQATLEAWGHSVSVARDGNSALEMVADETFDVIITDLRMPEVNGREFYEALHQRHPELAQRVVFSTGDTVRGETLDFLEQQARPCLHKPFSLTELRAALAKFG